MNEYELIIKVMIELFTLQELGTFGWMFSVSMVITAVAFLIKAIGSLRKKD